MQTETITYRFNNFKRSEIGAIPTLLHTVRGMKYGWQKVIDAFNKFVPKDEYSPSEKDEILMDILHSNMSDETPEKTLINKEIKND